jgi:hypothetical protein
MADRPESPDSPESPDTTLIFNGMQGNEKLKRKTEIEVWKLQNKFTPGLLFLKLKIGLKE